MPLFRKNRNRTDEEKLMTFGKPLKSYAYDPVGPAKRNEWGEYYSVCWEELKGIHLHEGPEEILDMYASFGPTHDSYARIRSITGDYIRRMNLKKPMGAFEAIATGGLGYAEDTRQMRAARYRTAAENLLREVGPDGLREYLYTGGHTDLEIEVIEGLCRERDIPISPIDADLWRERRRRERNPVKKPRKTTFNFRKAENNEHRTPRRSNPTVARPVLSRVGRNDAARTYGAYQELFEQGFRRRSEVERAVHQAAREGYGIFYPGHPALRGNGA